MLPFTFSQCKTLQSNHFALAILALMQESLIVCTNCSWPWFTQVVGEKMEPDTFPASFTHYKYLMVQRWVFNTFRNIVGKLHFQLLGIVGSFRSMFNHINTIDKLFCPYLKK